MNPFDRAASQLNLCRDRLLALPEGVKAAVSDIRFAAGQPVSLWGRDGPLFLTASGVSETPGPEALRANRAQLQELFLHICGRSVFSHEQEIREGYVQMEGGCRAGICGRAVVEEGRVRSLRDISSVSIRIPREVQGCSDRLIARLGRSGVLSGLLIAGEPGSGKTTLLRDLARSLSMGLGGIGRSLRVSVIDSRGELSPGFDLGPAADVLTGVPKAQGFQTAIRCLSPEVIVCDELAQEDMEAVRASVSAGVGLIATVHGRGGDPMSRPLLRELAASGAFRALAVLRGRDSPFGIAQLRRLGEGGGP